MNMDKKQQVLEELGKSEREFAEFEDIYAGPGLLKKVKRLAKFRGAYVKYTLARAGFMRRAFSDVTVFESMLTGLREMQLAQFFIRNMKEGDVFYDIGANEGFFSGLVQQAFADAVEIHAFEPIADLFAILKEEVQGGVKVFLNNVAVSDKEGTFPLYIPVKNLTLIGSSTLKKDAAQQNIRDFTEIQVQSTTLDTYIKKNTAPTYIKMDIEGSEADAIAGGKETLSKHYPVIGMEVWSGDKGLNFSLRAIKKLLDIGYAPYELLAGGDVKEIRFEDVLNYIYSNRSTANFVFKKK
ncbi:hypothetical protein A2755_01115 [Candidatus Wolfebacteria bacterium RIFCSPHIGHO2_01_FULL_48_22]|uniref:Methyltransferase FkbM domain-containing protein n=2 Tax=Candidatus Wolfeibacteriota TaxID=1752735 RepID=A0A1F8DUS0_9BACT|nr:MAG: hypothetical protein A2755_01115 [Candidatus Wolfebacteria bacterium RIFCSPHIGHO2_01_FULL_48_22]OGM93945.1 MAG: hypothetical protein A2935_03680 [Candidatus Wolfebacteria bacterium RIFCSPLOWO2_01_FULL_47_17b]